MAFHFDKSAFAVFRTGDKWTSTPQPLSFVTLAFQMDQAASPRTFPLYCTDGVALVTTGASNNL